MESSNQLADKIAASLLKFFIFKKFKIKAFAFLIS